MLRANLGLLPLSFAVTAIIGCSALLPANPRSNKRSDEQVSLELLHNESMRPKVKSECVKPAADSVEEKALPAIAAAAIPVIADFAIKQTKKSIDEEAKQYVAEYTTSAADDMFYACRGPQAPVNLRGGRLRRTVAGEPAFILNFAVEPALDETAFRIVPTSAEMSYAKAKVLGTRWYLPWTWFLKRRNAVDVDVKLTVEALWTDEKDAVHRAVLGDLALPIRGIPLGPKGEAQQPMLSPSGWFPLVPRSRPPASDREHYRYGLGNYLVTVAVREYDDAGKRVEKISEFVEEFREPAVKQIEGAAKDDEEN